MVDMCNKVEVLGVEVLGVEVLRSKKEKGKDLERKMRKSKLEEGEEEVVVIGEELIGEELTYIVEVYNAKIGVCRVKSEKKYEKGTRLRVAIYKVEEKTKLAVVP
jgi:hypothetical protein